jgi:hypothetical protein
MLEQQLIVNFTNEQNIVTFYDINLQTTNKTESVNLCNITFFLKCAIIHSYGNHFILFNLECLFWKIILNFFVIKL